MLAAMQAGVVTLARVLVVGPVLDPGWGEGEEKEWMRRSRELTGSDNRRRVCVPSQVMVAMWKGLVDSCR